MGDYFFIALASLLTTVITSIVGFADKLALIAVLNLFMGVKEAVVIAAFYSLAVYLVRILFFWPYLDKDLALKMVLFLIPGIIVGLVVFNGFEPSQLRLIFSTFLLIFVFYKLFFGGLDFKLSKLGLGIGVLIFGLVEASIGAAGPLLAVFLFQYGKRKEEFVVLAAVTLLASSLTRIGGYAYYGLITASNLSLIFLLLGVAVVGTYLGKRLMERLPIKAFEYLILLLLFLIGIKDIFFG